MLNGINHFCNKKILEEYAHKRGLFSPKLSVRLGGVLLIIGGILLNWHFTQKIAIISLSVFLIIATFTIHSFWLEKDRQQRMLEVMNFSKNLAILTELIYIGFA